MATSTHPSLPLALDAMGGDRAPACVIEGAALARERFPWLRYVIYGQEPLLAPLIASYPALQSYCRIVHTEAFVAANEKPSVALRQGRQTSMRLAIEAVKDGEAFGVVSAGNTGALMAMAKTVLRTLPGISRPAMCALFPTVRGECVMLDLGANVSCDGEDLYQFAIMGNAFARAILGLPAPRIGVLNVGSEEMKGHEEVRLVAQKLRNSWLAPQFYGFVEGDDLAQGTVDVIVTDGFSGNIALKAAEGTARMVIHFIKEAFRSSLAATMGYALAKQAIGTLRHHLDPRRHNGAMFVGLNGIAVKSHGSADGYSFSNAIAVAVELAREEVNRKITEEVMMPPVASPPAAA